MIFRLPWERFGVLAIAIALASPAPAAVVQAVTAQPGIAAGGFAMPAAPSLEAQDLGQQGPDPLQAAGASELLTLSPSQTVGPDLVAVNALAPAEPISASVPLPSHSQNSVVPARDLAGPDTQKNETAETSPSPVAQATLAAGALKEETDGASSGADAAPAASWERLDAVFDRGTRARPVAVDVPWPERELTSVPLDRITREGIPRSAIDDSLRFQKILAAVLNGEITEPPKEAPALGYLLIPGFGWERYPNYFRPNMETLASWGLRAELVPIRSLGNERTNARIIARAIAALKRPAAILAHSMAGLHARQALELDRELRRAVAKFVAIQTPFSGTSLADWFVRHPAVFDMMVLAAKLMHPGRLKETRLFHHYDTVWEMSREHPDRLQTRPVPLEPEKLFSLTSQVNSFDIRQFPFWLRTHVIRSLPKRGTDGAIETGRTIAPHSRFAILNDVNHSDPIEDPSPGPVSAFLEPHRQPAGFAAALTLAILHWIFSR